MKKGIRTFWEHGVMPMEKQNKITKLETEIKSHPREQNQTYNRTTINAVLSVEIGEFVPMRRKLFKLRERLVSILQAFHHHHQTSQLSCGNPLHPPLKFLL